MKNILQNLRIKTKLLAGFILVSCILLITGVREHYVLRSISESQSYIVNSLTISDAIMEAKYYIRSDIQQLMEITLSNDLDEIEAWWNEHNLTVQGFKNNLQILNESTVTDESSEFFEVKRKVNDYAVNTTSVFDSIVIPDFEQVYKLCLHKVRLANLKPEITVAELESTGFTDGFTPVNDSVIILDDDINTQTEDIVVDSDYSDLDLIGVTELLADYDNQLDTTYNYLLNSLDKAQKITEIVVTASKKNTNNLIEQALTEIIFIVLVGLLVSVIIAVFISNSIVYPIRDLMVYISRLRRGELPDDLQSKTRNEIGDIINALNMLVNSLRKVTGFSVEIGKGNFESLFSPLSGNDVLGNALLDMRRSLKQASDESIKRQKEDELSSWATNGEAKFAEILRFSKDFDELSNNIIKNIVKYLDANQGGLFIYSDADPNDVYLELVAAYAYDRKKYIKRKIKIGEGLVGMCAVEKDTVHITDIPNDYIEIQSGIGEANPRSLMLVPLKVEDNVLGIIEIASFNEFKAYQIKFLERVAEIIAASFSTARINKRTEDLLKKSQLQAQEMAEKEEEMLQTIEEMRAAQEEAIRREELLEEKISEVTEMRNTLVGKDKEQQDQITNLRLENEEQMRELVNRELQNRKVLESCLDSVLIISQFGIIEFFNPAAEKLWDIHANDVLGKNVSVLMPEQFAKAHNEKIAKYLETGIKKIIGKGREVPILKKDETTIDVYLSVTEIKVDNTPKFVGFIKDISELKLRERERDKITEQLMAKEFEYQSKIEQLEDLLFEHGVDLPKSKSKHKVEEIEEVDEEYDDEDMHFLS